VPWALCVLLISTALWGCGSSREVAGSGPELVVGEFHQVTDDIPEDSTLTVVASGYRNQMESHIAEVIGRADSTFVKGNPEGALGNLAADAMLDVIQGLVDEPVDCALTNNGGLRVPIAEGPITVGKVFELMPFENWMSVVTLDADGMSRLFSQIATVGGEPIAGCALTIDSETREVVEATVGGESVEEGKMYRVVTSDYLVNGGGNMEALWSPVKQEGIPVLLRDAFLTYIRENGVISPNLDGRITYVER